VSAGTDHRQVQESLGVYTLEAHRTVTQHGPVTPRPMPGMPHELAELTSIVQMLACVDHNNFR
jgi:hypothetical protein